MTLEVKNITKIIRYWRSEDRCSQRCGFRSTAWRIRYFKWRLWFLVNQHY